HASLHQPHRQRRQPARTRRSERWTVVGAYRLGQPELAKCRVEHRPHVLAIHALHSHHANDIAARLVLHRQGIAARPIAGPEPALEVDAPRVVGLPAVRQRPRARRNIPPTLAPLRQPRVNQQFPHRARRRPRNLRMIQLQPPLQLLRPPRRLLAPQRQDRVALSLANSVRATMRRMAPLSQPRRPLNAPARQHLIARLAADAELTAKLRHRYLASFPGHAKPRLLLHRTGLRPCHRSNLPRFERSLRPVTHPPGLFRYPSCRIGPPHVLSPRGEGKWASSWRPRLTGGEQARGVLDGLDDLHVAGAAAD